MYEAHFGLQSRPFGTKAVGPAVFTGPQQAKTVRGLHQGLVAQDAVVTVAGPTGVGKTTIVGRALDSIKPNRMAAWIGRMHLSPEELLDLLLAGFGAGKPVQGSIRRFALFRRIMAQRAAAGTAVAVVVEDAKRLGVDTLAELEALTAADTGDAAGANIILMGQPDLAAFLKNPALARLKQRIRRREKVGEFSQPEVAGYLRHCLRQAGGDYDRIFERGVDQIIYRASEGVARVVNTLAENALQAAAEEGLKHITTGLMHEVASDNYTYEGPLPEFPADSDIDWEAAPTAEAVGHAEAQNDSLIPDEKELPPAARNIVVESGRYPELPDTDEENPVAADPAPLPAVESAARQPETAPVTQPARAGAADEMPTGDEIEIPELINDTQPELSALPMPKSDEAVGSGEPAASATAAPAASPADKPLDPQPPPAAAGDEESFDLDAALAIDVESTNVMEGITPNLEKLAATAQAANAGRPPAAPEAAADDLPTLSNSMRVDVAREVRRAQQTADKPAATAGKAATPPPRPAAMAKPGQAGPSVATRPKPPATTRAAPPQRPAPAGAPAAPKAAPPAAAKAPAKPAAAGPDDEVLPAVLEPEPELLAAMEPSPEPEWKEEPAPAAEAGQSEMTRRIAAIGADKRRDDVDSLEAALESAKKQNQDGLFATPAGGKPKVTPAPAAPQSDPVPELKLDIELTSTQKRRKDELRKAAAEISRAKSIEEFDDKMAETLFGDEDLEAIAADVIANPPPGYEAPPKSRDHEKASPPPSGPSPVLLDDPLGGGPRLDDEPAPKTVPKAGNGKAPAANGGLRDAKVAEQGAQARPANPAKPAAPRPAKAAPPESIENQINTSITQRMAALDLSRLGDGPADDSDDKPEKKSGGFFSRFRRSS